MVIDMHGHVSSPPELYAYRSVLIAGRGAHGREGITLPTEKVTAAAERHVGLLDKFGIDVQFLSARPFQLGHSEGPADIVRWWATATNNAVAAQVKAFPDRFRGVAALPQALGTTPEDWLDELERCVGELGFVGALVNPDPAEGQDGAIPRIGHEWWYPLFAKLQELDVPALIHAASCKDPRENYSEHMITEASRSAIGLANSNVFKDFPDLKLVISHGGGSVPYQIGRWRAARYLEFTQVESFDGHAGEVPEIETFDEALGHLYFDSLVHDPDGLALLIKKVGADHVLLGTEVPGSGTPIDPSTGRQFDDIVSNLKEVDGLTDADRDLILEGNARKLYTRF